MPRAFIGIGSNIDPERSIRTALQQLSASVRLVALSTFYRDPALGRPDEPDFYNGVAAIETDLTPAALKWQVLRPIEAALGRRRGPDRYAPRTIDLDLLLFDGCIVQDANAGLTLPDPSIQERPFLALPLRELAPDLSLPALGSIREIADHVPLDGLQPLAGFTQRLRTELLGDGASRAPPRG